jgi:predicted DNA-binding antitoxin AbrB/MazE fold protein
MSGCASADHFGGFAIPFTFEAIYENGFLRPSRPLPLKEHEKVQVTIDTPHLDIIRAAGIMGWKGDAEMLERIALDPEFLPEEDV